MSRLNWILAGVSALFWGVAFVWFFRGMIRQAWAERHDKWFRD